MVLTAMKATDETVTDEAFRRLYDRHKDGVFSFLARLLRDDALAEDVLQETFLRVHRSLDSYDPERSERAWVFQIARNAALDAIRVRKKTERILEETRRRSSTESQDATDLVARREEETSTRRALESLPPDVRAMLLQRHGLDMKVAELAESWSCTEKTVTARLRAAATKLAEELFKLRAAREGGRS